MSDSAKLHLCYGIILLILSFLCFAGFVSGICLAVLMDNSYVKQIIVLAIFALTGTIALGGACVFQLLEAGTYMEKEESR